MGLRALAEMAATPPALRARQMGPVPEGLPHDNAALHLNTTIWVLIGLSALFLAARLYCKFQRHRGLWWDDYVLIGSWVCITVESCLLTYATTLGYGLHIWDMAFDVENINKMTLVINLSGTFSLTAATWSKTSFALTMLRLTDGWIKILIWFIIVSTNIAMGLSALFVWVQCTPVQKAWNPFMDGTCWHPSVIVHYNIFSAAYSATMDLSLALLPWKVIWGLQMKKKEKIGVALAMSCGIFAGVTALIKTAKIPAMQSQDIYDGVDLFIWGNAESCVTIIAASIPVLRVIVREVKSSARKYYVAGGETYPEGFTKQSRLRSQNNTVVVTAQRSRMASHKQDDWSDKSILDGNRPNPGKIVQTNEVAVEYQDRKDAESIEYEMDDMRRV